MQLFTEINSIKSSNFTPSLTLLSKKEKFRSEGRKSEVQLRLEQKRMFFLQDSLQKEESDIMEFMDEKTNIFGLINKEKSKKTLIVLRKVTCLDKEAIILKQILKDDSVMKWLESEILNNYDEEIRCEVLWILINLTTGQKDVIIYDFTGLVLGLLERMERIYSVKEMNNVIFLLYTIIFIKIPLDILVFLQFMHRTRAF